MTGICKPCKFCVANIMQYCKSGRTDLRAHREATISKLENIADGKVVDSCDAASARVVQTVEHPDSIIT